MLFFTIISASFLPNSRIKIDAQTFFGGKIIKNIWNTQVFKRKILKNVILHLCRVFLRIMNFPEDIPKIPRR